MRSRARARETTLLAARRGDVGLDVFAPTALLGAPRATAAQVVGPSREQSGLDLAMDRYADGDDAAFAAVYDLLTPKLFGFLLRQTRNEAQAEDLVQQTLLRIHRARGAFVRGAPVLPWAYAIARRLMIDQSRRGRREVLARTDEELGLEPMSLDPSADDWVAARQTAERIAEEMARLPENQRVAFELVKQGRSGKCTARRQPEI